LLLAFAPAYAWAQAQPVVEGDAVLGGDAAVAAEPESDDARARRLYLQGDRLYAEGSYLAAVEAFQEAYELSRRPLLLFNLANAYERLGRHADAVDALDRYLPHAPAHEQDSLRRRVANLRELVDKRRAEEAAAAQAASEASAPPPSVAPQPTETYAQRDDTGWMRTTGWVLVGTGAAFLVGGGAAAGVAATARGDADDLCVDGICPDRASDAVDRDRTFSVLADVGIGVGAGALVTGIIFLLSSDDVADHARVQVGRDGVALRYAGAF
jgi:tetratricopeptide (TPR) repeat protein